MIPDPLSIANEIYDIAKGIYDKVKTVKANKAQSQRLADRILIITAAVKDLEKQSNLEHYEQGLISLKQCLTDCSNFIDKYKDSSKWYKYIVKTGIYQTQFAEFYQQLQDAMIQLSLSLIAQQIINGEQDKLDQAADSQFIKDKQDEIIKLNKKANKKLIKLDKNQDEYFNILRRQGAELDERIKALNIQATSAKPLIDPHHTIYYSDLRIDKKLTEGSFGKIYLGRHHKEVVVIKTLEGQLSEPDQQQFVREVAIMSRLHHKNVTQFYGACLESNRACIVMEYMEKGSLYDLLGQEHLQLEQKKQIALDITRGLYYLHKQGVLHRDLKSANVLIDLYGRAKLTDFGLAKIKSGSIGSIKDRSHAFQWQAPECLKEPGYYISQSDIYSLGIIFWELFTGQRPYKKYKDAPEKLYQAIQKGKYEEIPESIPKEFAKVIKDCWHQDPYQRPKLKTILQQIEAQVIQQNDNNNVQPTSISFPEKYRQQAIECEEQAFKIYQKAASENDIYACARLGLFFLRDKADTQQAYKYLLKAAQSNDAKSMFKVAKLLEQGNGTEKNLEEALDWYQKASLQQDDKNVQTKAKLSYERLKNVSIAPPKPGA